MADVPVTEIRRVVVQYTVTGPGWQKAPSAPAQPSLPELARAVRDEMIRMGSRDPDVLGGRA